MSPICRLLFTLNLAFATSACVHCEDTSAQFDKIIERRWDKDEKIRKAAEKEFEEFEETHKSPSVAICSKALEAAARAYPFEEPDRKSVSRDLLSLVEKNSKPEFIPIIIKLFDEFDDEGKERSQRILNTLKTEEAAQALMTLVRTHAPVGKLPLLLTYGFENDPRHTKVFFPELFTYASNPKVSYDIYALCLAHCKAKQLSAKDLTTVFSQALQAFRADVKKLSEIEKRTDIYLKLADQQNEATKSEDFKQVSILMKKESDMQSEDNLAREESGLLLDLFRYFSAELAEPPLREALNLNDAKLRFFAVESLMAMGKPVDQKHIDYIAGNPETRRWLIDSLTKDGKLSPLFPKEFLTQKAFAESDMVHRLMFPTELNKAPDEIELMKVVPIDTGLKDGIYEYYVFRFRTKPPHWAAKDGWMAGVSGPFLKGSTHDHSLGDTFSTFVKWGEKTPEELVGDTKELMKKWREHHLKEKK